MNRDELITILLGTREAPAIPDDPVPDYLRWKYDREGAALNLVELGTADHETLGALLRASLVDCEEDVRLAALEGLASLAPTLAVPVLVACSYDRDGQVRAASLLKLNEIDPSSAAVVANRLAADDDISVVNARREVIGKGIQDGANH